jgi:hypothetical protein
VTYHLDKAIKIIERISIAFALDCGSDTLRSGGYWFKPFSNADKMSEFNWNGELGQDAVKHLTPC